MLSRQRHACDTGMCVHRHLCDNDMFTHKQRHVSAYMSLHLCLCIPLSMYAQTYISMCAQTYIFVHPCLSMSLSMCAQTSLFVCVYADMIGTYVCVSVNICTDKAHKSLQQTHMCCNKHICVATNTYVLQQTHMCLRLCRDM